MSNEKQNNEENDKGGFLSRPRERRASAAGAAPGLITGLTFGTPLFELALGAAVTVALVAIGAKQLSNKKLTKDIHKEALYALGFLAIGFALGYGIVFLI